LQHRADNNEAAARGLVYAQIPQEANMNTQTTAALNTAWRLAFAVVLVIPLLFPLPFALPSLP
jgi:hypothetical protein